MEIVPRRSIGRAVVLLAGLACGGGAMGPVAGPVEPVPTEPPPAVPAPSPFDAVTDAVQRAVDSIPTLDGAAVVLEQGGSVVYERGFGDLGVDDDALMASVSKLLTAIVVLSVVDDGALSLDEPIHRWLPEFDDLEMSGITLRHLLSHTSGLTNFQLCAMEFPDGSRTDPTPTLRECARQIADRGPFVAPGEAFRYSNPAFTVAGALAEVAASSQWRVLYDARLADPLGLVRTRWGNGANPPLGGGGWSTAREYARVLRTLADGGVYAGRRILSEEIVAEMMRDQNADVDFEITPRAPRFHYGLGLWRERVGPDGEARMVSSLGGFGFAGWIDRERDLVGVVVVPQNLGPHGAVVGRVWSLVEQIVPTISSSPSSGDSAARVRTTRLPR